jgi:thiosulfate dehydrogenase [quinone] large subunit
MPAIDRGFILFFRLAMAWIFLYAASQQISDPNFSVVGFLSHAKTFRDLFAPLATPTVAPAVTFLVTWGHLLIGLSLLVGLYVRISASTAALLFLLYWLGAMDWPYIENRFNFILDQHIIYVGICAYLVAKSAGTVGGLDAWLRGVPSAAPANEPASAPGT